MSRLTITRGRYEGYSLDGERIARVSTIKNISGSKDGLIGGAVKETALWAAIHAPELETVGDIRWVADCKRAYREKWDAAARAGTQVHSIAERLVYGEPVETSDPKTGEPYSEDVLLTGAQVADFMDRWDVDPASAYVERPVFHAQFKYAGRFDLLAVLRGGERWLIDYKSGASGVWPDTALQLTAYSRATHIVLDEHDERMPRVDRCAALWVRPDYWELLPVKSDDDTFRTFLYAQRLLPWWQQRPEDVIGAALPVPPKRKGSSNG